MTAIAGLVDPGCPQFDSCSCAFLHDAIAPFGRDRQDSITWEGGYFLRALLRTTPEDSFDQQPLTHAESKQLLLFDGRLDNRAELGSQLGIPPVELARLADSELALRAILRWDSAAPTRFIGDFAMACWQPARRRLWLARDLVGRRSIYWTNTGGRLVFSSSARALLPFTDQPPAVELVKLHDHLCLLPYTGQESYFAGISRVESGYVAEFIDGRQVANRAHQSLDDIPLLRLKRDEDYVDALNELMTDIIRAQLRSVGPVSTQLSSGFDSATITHYAARELSRSGQRLTAYTAIPRPGYAGPVPVGKHADEGPAAALVAQSLGNIDHRLVDVHKQDWLSVTRQANSRLDMPVMNPFNNLWLEEINRQAAASGSRVLLHGQMGNVTFSYTGRDVLPYLLRSGRWAALWQECVAAQRAGQPWRRPLSRAVLPYFPEFFQLALRRWLKQGFPVINDFSAVSTALQARFDTLHRARHAGNYLSNLAPRSSNTARINALTRRDMSPYYLDANRMGLESRDPMADLRLARFCLSVPPDQFCRHGESRWLAKRLIQGRLPAEITHAATRGYQVADWHEHLDRSLPSTLKLVEELSVISSARDALALDDLKLRLVEWQSGRAPDDMKNVSKYSALISRALSVGLFIANVSAMNDVLGVRDGSR